MKLDKMDPRLTAYLAGELSEQDRRDLELALQQPQNAEARLELEALRVMVNDLTKALGQESEKQTGLTYEQQAHLQAQTTHLPNPGSSRKKIWWWATGGAVCAAAAAGLLLVLIPNPADLPQTDAANELPMIASAGSSNAEGHLLDFVVEEKAARIPPATKPSFQEMGVVGAKAPSFPPTNTYPSQAYSVSGLHNDESYESTPPNTLIQVGQHPLSTFSIDVDTASYSNVRRFLQSGNLPPPEAVRVEELVNYFDYQYPQPDPPRPFSVTLEVGDAPWNDSHRLVRIGLKGREISLAQRSPSNLVFLLDVSGSMQDANKLPLLQKAFGLLVDRLDKNDRVALVTYSTTAGLALASTSGSDKRTLLNAIQSLHADGSTNGGGGLALAYKTALQNYIMLGNNRVILATDGDFNTGVTNREALIRLVEHMAKHGVFLTVLGFGVGNYKDSLLEKLADRGDGNYAYIDSFEEAKRVFEDQLLGTLFSIAKDVKIQVEFNPAKVQAYRLIGYENRLLANHEFNDDKKDAGEIGAGHTVTALYELVRSGHPQARSEEPLKYQPVVGVPGSQDSSNELLTVKVRYKDPDEDKSQLLSQSLVDSEINRVREDFFFAAAVAEFGMLLRGDPLRGSASFEQVLQLAKTGKGSDAKGLRAEFIRLAELARSLQSSAQWSGQNPPLPLVEERRPISQAEVMEVMREHVPQFQACTRKQKEVDASVNGRMVIRFTIQPDGSVSDVANITPEFNGTLVAVCIIREIQHTKFPKHSGPPKIVPFPFTVK